MVCSGPGPRAAGWAAAGRAVTQHCIPRTESSLPHCSETHLHHGGMVAPSSAGGGREAALGETQSLEVRIEGGRGRAEKGPAAPGEAQGLGQEQYITIETRRHDGPSSTPLLKGLLLSVRLLSSLLSTAPLRQARPGVSGMQYSARIMPPYPPGESAWRYAMASQGTHTREWERR